MLTLTKRVTYPYDLLSNTKGLIMDRVAFYEGYMAAIKDVSQGLDLEIERLIDSNEISTIAIGKLQGLQRARIVLTENSSPLTKECK